MLSMVTTRVATIRAYRKAGGAVVTVERPDRPPHRCSVTLKRYRPLREWVAFGTYPWKSSGAWLKSSLNACLWTKEVTAPISA